MLKDPIQKTGNFNLRTFSAVFSDNLFNSDKNSCMQKHNKLRKKTIEALIHIIFSLDPEED